MNLDSDIAWCKRMFTMMAEKGVWAVPRSGMVFQKMSGRLELISAMPGMVDYKEFQREDLAIIKDRFGRAGITVEGEIK